jgi:hypothetical protein
MLSDWVQLLCNRWSTDFLVLRRTRSDKSMLKSEESKPFEVYFIESDHYWYVGCTTRSTPVRFAQHHSSKKSPVGKLAKQGVEFSWTVLEVGEGTRRDRIEAEQRWYEEKLWTHRGGRTLNRMPPAGGRPHWMEGAEFLLRTEFGQALLRAAIIEMAESALRESGYVRPHAVDSSHIGSCTPAQESAEASAP